MKNSKTANRGFWCVFLPEKKNKNIFSFLNREETKKIAQRKKIIQIASGSLATISLLSGVYGFTKDVSIHTINQKLDNISQVQLANQKIENAQKIAEKEIKNTQKLSNLSFYPLSYVQFLLSQHGYKVDIDGIYGQETEKAFTQFKIDKHLSKPESKDLLLIGPSTLKELQAVDLSQKAVKKAVKKARNLAYSRQTINPSQRQINSAVAAASRYNGVRNMCANMVKVAGTKLGFNTDMMDGKANSAKLAGTLITDHSQIKVGDIVGWDKTNRHGDEHVGIYVGNGEVLHQSASNGYRAGIYPHYSYFKSQRGFYIIRPYVSKSI